MQCVDITRKAASASGRQHDGTHRRDPHESGNKSRDAMTAMVISQDGVDDKGALKIVHGEGSLPAPHSIDPPPERPRLRQCLCPVPGAAARAESSCPALSAAPPAQTRPDQAPAVARHVSRHCTVQVSCALSRKAMRVCWQGQKGFLSRFGVVLRLFCRNTGLRSGRLPVPWISCS